MGNTKRNTKITFLVLILALSAEFSGCSKGSSSSSSTDNTTATTTTTTATPVGYNASDWTDGQTVDFKPVSFNTFNSYVGTHPLNDPSGYKINIKLTQVPDQLYFGGEIKVGYVDNGSWFQGVFSAGTGKNVNCSHCNDNDLYESRYNYFYSVSGKKIFTGFFQDRFGSIVLVLEPVTAGSDGEGGLYKGTVWYKNFAQSLTSQSSNRKCWDIYNGPFTCTSSSVSSKTSYSSIDGYTKLGTFSGIDLNVAIVE